MLNKVLQFSFRAVVCESFHVVHEPTMAPREVPLSVREQREMIRTQLREKKIEELYSAWVEELRGRAYVELRDLPQ